MAGPSSGKRFFDSGVSLFTSFGFFAALSILCITVDHKIQFMDPVRSSLADFSEGAYRMVSGPLEGLTGLSEHVRSKARLVYENKALREENKKLQLDALRFEEVLSENLSLRQLLKAKESYAVPSQLFDVIRVNSDGYTQTFTIKGGSDDGLKVGMPVISEAGLAGQIIRVSQQSSLIQLIQDKDQQIPVMFKRAGVFGVLQGSGDGSTLISRDLPFNEEIKPGDKVITSGLDGIYPRGIPVGVVMQSKPSAADIYSNVSVACPKSINKGNSVLVLLVDTERVNALRENEEVNDGQRRRAVRR